MQLSPAIPKELRMSLSRRKKPVVPAGIRSTTSASGAGAPHRLPSLLKGKREANELASSGDSSKPAIRRPATGAGSAPMPAITGEHAASCNRHLVPTRREGRRTQLSWLHPSPLFSQVGRSSTQPWIHTLLKPLSRPRQSIGACLATCTGLWATSRLAPIQTPSWPTPAYPQGSVLIIPHFYFRCTWHPCLPGLVAGVLPWRSDAQT